MIEQRDARLDVVPEERVADPWLGSLRPGEREARLGLARAAVQRLGEREMLESDRAQIGIGTAILEERERAQVRVTGVRGVRSRAGILRDLELGVPEAQRELGALAGRHTVRVAELALCPAERRDAGLGGACIAHDHAADLPRRARDALCAELIGTLDRHGEQAERAACIPRLPRDLSAIERLARAAVWIRPEIVRDLVEHAPRLGVVPRALMEHEDQRERVVGTIGDAAGALVELDRGAKVPIGVVDLAAPERDAREQAFGERAVLLGGGRRRERGGRARLGGIELAFLAERLGFVEPRRARASSEDLRVACMLVGRTGATHANGLRALR